MTAPRPPCVKKPFTFAAAEAALLAARIAQALRPNTKRREQRIYCCRQCQAWHLTSKPARPERTDAP